jgi:hypothetical protein
MAEHSLRPAGQDGGDPSTAGGEAAVADGVDAAVDAVEVAATIQRSDPRPAVAQPLELPSRHHSVLSSRQFGQRLVTWTIEWSYTVASICHVPRVAQIVCRVGDGACRNCAV